MAIVTKSPDVRGHNAGCRCRGSAAHLLNSIHIKGETSRRVVGRFGGKHEANRQPRVQYEIPGRHVRSASDWLCVG